MVQRSGVPVSSSLLLQEAWVVVAALITLLGTKLCWSSARSRMSIEESAKDGHLTDEQARKKIRAIEIRGPLVVFLGVGLLAYALLR